MSDHEHYKGGHELDAPPTRQLFNIVWGLGAITFLSIITCVQLFNQQRDALQSERYGETSWRLAQYQDEQAKQRYESGEYALNDNGKEVTISYVPLARATEKVLADPKLLQAAPPPPGFVHPDDLASGGAAAPAPAPTPAPAPAPAEGAEAAAGAEGATAGPATPEGDAKPAEAGADSKPSDAP
jgi:hypothetical protein